MKNATAIIDFNLCKACLLCIEVCRKNSLEQGSSLNPAGYLPVRFIENGQCNGCAMCAVRCPDAAIEIYENE